MGPRPRVRDTDLKRRPQQEDRAIPRPFRAAEPTGNVGTGVRAGQGEEGGWLGRESPGVTARRRGAKIGSTTRWVRLHSPAPGSPIPLNPGRPGPQAPASPSPPPEARWPGSSPGGKCPWRGPDLSGIGIDPL